MIKDFSRPKANRVEVQIEFPYILCFTDDFGTLQDVREYFYLRSNYNLKYPQLYESHFAAYKVLMAAEFYDAELTDIRKLNNNLVLQFDHPSENQANSYFEFIKKSARS